MDNRPKSPWGPSSAFNWFLRGMMFVPLGALIAWLIGGKAPEPGEIVFLVAFAAVFAFAAWRRRVWPFGPN